MPWSTPITTISSVIRTPDRATGRTHFEFVVSHKSGTTITHASLFAQPTKVNDTPVATAQLTLDNGRSIAGVSYFTCELDVPDSNTYTPVLHDNADLGYECEDINQ